MRRCPACGQKVEPHSLCCKECRSLAAQLEAVREERDHYAGRYREERDLEAQLEAARKREQWLIEKNEEIQRWADTRLEAAQASHEELAE